MVLCVRVWWAMVHDVLRLWVMIIMMTLTRRITTHQFSWVMEWMRLRVILLATSIMRDETLTISRCMIGIFWHCCTCFTVL